MQERKTNHALLHLACEQMLVEQLQRKNWVRQPNKELCMGVRELPVEDLCIGVRQSPIDECYSLELVNSQ